MKFVLDKLVHFTTYRYFIMTQVTPEQKESATKTLAIIGFVTAILFAVWLAVQIVNIIPSAFSSLASIADGVYNYNEDTTLTVATKNSVVNTGEAFKLSWTDLNRAGTYNFSYSCSEGTSLEIRTHSGDVQNLMCNTLINLKEQTSLDVIVQSEKSRFIDITYTVTHVPENTTMYSDVSTISQITIVNASIPTHNELVNTPTEKPEGVVAGESTTETPQTISVPKTKVEEKILYAIPTSNPNGDIDLKISYLGVGTLTGKTFKKEATIDMDKQGAFQFSVQNIGTKTSKSWEFEAHLPEGIEYSSDKQVALKPNEKAIITIGFEGLSRKGTEKFGVDITAKHDVNKNNNSFTWAVEVVK